MLVVTVAPMIRGVIFDLFGTLTDGRLEWERERLYLELAMILKVPGPSFARLMHETFHLRSTGAFGDVRQTLMRLCSLLGAQPDATDLDAAVELRLRIERRLAEPRADAVNTLQRLRERGLSISVISDCGPETAVVWPTLPFAHLVESPVFSCDVKQRKPHPSLYRLAATRIGVEPGQCLYVGDGGSRELTGARHAGMRAVRLAVPGEDWGSKLRFDPDSEWSGQDLSSLSELLDREIN